jgi:hypothetical protein
LRIERNPALLSVALLACGGPGPSTDSAFEPVDERLPVGRHRERAPHADAGGSLNGHLR